MENNKKDPASIVDGWLDDILKKVDLPEDIPTASDPELGPDEQAIAKAGLIHPDDVELEQIVQETLAENWSEPPAAKQEAEPQDATRYFDTQSVAEAAQIQEQIPVEPEQKEEAQVEAEAPQEDESVNDPLIRKLRPKAKKGYGLWGIPHIISTVIWLALILAIGVSLGRTVWLCAKDVLALGKESMAVTITIAEDDEIGDVAQKLKDVGLIEYPKLFEMFTKLTGKGENMLRGTIEFNVNAETDANAEKLIYDYNALANALSYRGTSRVTVDVMIPEGYNCSQIFALLEEKGVCSAVALEKYAATGELKGYWFLDGIERGDKYCLEGFLFPDTYEFYMGDEAGRVIQKMLNAFDYRFTDRMIDKFMSLNRKTGLSLSIRDVVTMASIVEKEKASDGEGYSIASVFYNRLRNSASFPFLQSDATIKYDVDYRSKGALVTDAQINASPYNTYTKKGLPAGPIANPGLSSLDAALDPEETSYFFFIYDKGAGMHRFSKTLAEHNAWARKLGLA